MFNPKSSLKYLLFSLYFMVLFGVVAKLFFEAQFDAAFSKVVNLARPQQSQTMLKIGYAEPYISLSPLANDVGSRSRLLHVFEPLVRVTPDLQIEPALALSYGAINDVTWEFRLRTEVTFHNGDALTIQDVITALTRARDDKKSEAKDLASTIKEIQAVDDSTLRIITTVTDPLLLQKISSLLIFKEPTAGEFVGTGPYTIKALPRDSRDELMLESFAQYWGPKPSFKEVTLKTLSNKEQRNNALREGTVDILANVAPDTALNFNFPTYTLSSVPSIEVNFLLFNFNSVFKARELREAVSLSLNQDTLSSLTQGFATATTQFIGKGIFGYNPFIERRPYDPKKAKELVAQISPNAPLTATLDLPTGLEIFGSKISQQLLKSNIHVVPQYLSSQALSKKIVAHESPFFFFGWRSDLGDASDFLTAVVHSPKGTYGQFNGGNYRNEEVDSLIEQSQKTIKTKDRMEMLRTVMKKITDDDIIGVPLFSPEVLYGVSKKVEWKPRVDGYILAQEARL